MRFIFLLLFVKVIYAGQVDPTLYEGDIKERYQKIEQSFIDANQTTKEQKEQLDYHKSLVQKIKTIYGKKFSALELNLENLSGKSISQESYYSYIQALVAMYVKIGEIEEKQKDFQNKIGFLKNRIEKLDDSEKELLFSLQLQYAIYKLQQVKNSEELKQLDQATKTLFTALSTSIQKVDFVDNSEKISRIKTEIEKNDKKMVSLQVKKERQLITAEKVDAELEKELGIYQEKNENLFLQQIDLVTKDVLYAIKKKESSEIVNQLQTLEELYANVKPDSNQYEAYSKVVQKLITERLGTFNALFTNTQKNVQKSFLSMYDWFSSPLFTINEQSISLLGIVKVFIILIIGFIIGWIYKKRIISLKEKWPKMSLMSIKLLANTGYYVIMLITFTIALVSIGLDLTSLSLIAGALSIGIGFGLQTVVSNFVAGIILMFERSIRIGDLLEISDTLKGEVTDIRIRSTTIRTFDNIEIIVPNATFIQSNVINWTLEDSIRRLHIPFSVAYGSDFDQVKNIVLDAVESSDLDYVRNIKSKKPRVWMTAMGASSLDMELLVWINSNSDKMPFKSDFLVLIYKTLNEHGIPIPFPQMDVHLKKE